MKLKNFFLGTALFIVGLLMAIAPKQFFEVIVILIGATIVISGCYNLITYYKVSDDIWFKKTMFWKSIIGICVGLLAVICPLAIVNSVETVLKIFCFILSISSLGFAIGSFATASKLDAPVRKRFTIEGLTYIAIAVVLFIFGFGSLAAHIVRLIGIIAAVIGVFMIIMQSLILAKAAPEKAEVISVVDDEPESKE